MNLFETHMTLLVQTSDDFERLEAWAAARGLKWTHIQLDQGDFASQPMLTYRGTGTLDQQLNRAEANSAELAECGDQVVRVKIETELNGTDVPRNGLNWNDGQYFEYHIKLHLPRASDLGDAATLAANHGARLSRNARRVMQDGAAERFVTLRARNVGRDQANQLRDRLVEDLRRGSYCIAEIESEFVLFDSAISLDSGWL